ncbi:MAG: hypothetical protein K0S10_1102, partial [Rubrobacteraceae bacterium]|nr:hypothetical protein [Rubrobacteraceae bacterium]
SGDVGSVYSLRVRRRSATCMEEARVNYGFIIPKGDPRTVAELAREAEEAG